MPRLALRCRYAGWRQILVGQCEVIIIKPPTLEELCDFQSLCEILRFFDVGVCAKSVRAPDVVGVHRRAEDNDNEALEAGLVAYPFQNLQAGALGKFAIEQDKARQRVLLAVSERTGPREVIGRHVAVSDDVKRLVIPARWNTNFSTKTSADSSST